jgi:chemotaxis response regulator CheB
MPKQAILLGAAGKVVPLNSIAQAISRGFGRLGDGDLA